MGPQRTRRQLLVSGMAAALLVAAGCTGLSGTEARTTETPTTTDLEYTFPDPPESLDESAAEDAAAQYHLALLAQRTAANSAIESVDLPSVEAADTSAVESDEGYVVSVETEYVVVANDTVERNESATYLVTADRIRRAAASGRLSVDTYRVGELDQQPLSLRLVNFRGGDRELSVIVTHLDGSPATALLESATVPARSSVAIRDALAAAGEYRVTVSTGDRTASTTLTYSGDQPDRPIGVYLCPDGGLEIERGP